MLVEYLNPGAEKPNFMRSAEVFTLPRWTTEEGRGYLKEGFRSYGISITNELELSRAVGELGGVPGFISHYGITVVNFVRTGKTQKKHFQWPLRRARNTLLGNGERT